MDKNKIKCSEVAKSPYYIGYHKGLVAGYDLGRKLRPCTFFLNVFRLKNYKFTFEDLELAYRNGVKDAKKGVI